MLSEAEGLQQVMVSIGACEKYAQPKTLSTGDISSETVLIQYLMPKLNMLVKKTVWDPNIAEDIRQDVLEVMVRKFRDGVVIHLDSAVAYAIGVCRYQLYAHIKKRKRNAELFIYSVETDGLTLMADDHCYVLQTLLKGESAQMVKLAIANLTQERDRVVLTEFYLYDKPVACLSKQFGVSAMHFYRIIFRAKKRLFEELLKLGYWS
ncbi:MAG: sigma-70 family RNA polymerase sigma factor [Algicola sp.]|nr:sigma-70 family RNA polymerase sigma factor [Algicola sp.]